jgi:hypothetical protein
MRKFRIFVVATTLICNSIFFLLAPPPLNAQDSSPGDDEREQLAQDLFVEINQSLITEEYTPLARNETLDRVAQTIAEELTETGTYTSLPTMLADEEGYPRWPDNGQRVISQPFNYIGTQRPFEVANFWSNSLIDTLDSSFFREIGIGISNFVAVEGGTVQNVYVIVLGAQPNVLPVVINDGAEVVYSRDVSLYLHNEQTLAYFTDEDTIQFATRFRVANAEEDLASAEWREWEGFTNPLDWELTEEFGEKSVWAEYEDEKGTRVQYEAIVEYADPAERTGNNNEPSTSSPAALLSMSYGGDTFTLQIESDRESINIQELYFSWLDGLRVYEIENAEDLEAVDLENFNTDSCLQIRTRATEGTMEFPECDTVFLEDIEFTEVDMVFWNPEFEVFTVFLGPEELGSCDSSAGRCELELP